MYLYPITNTVHLKERIKQFRQSRYALLRLIYISLRPLARAWRLVLDPAYRSEVFTRKKYKGQHYQGAVFTIPDRYPRLFAAATAHLASVSRPLVLSFGCATGEEVATLGRYMPAARITGVDINEWCLTRCRKNYTDRRFSFVHRLSPEFAEAGGFDAIFALAVFQRAENRLNTDNSVAEGFTFQQFESEIVLLDGKLKPGGLFIIDNADFSFTDTCITSHYAPLEFEKNQFTRQRPLFNRNNLKIADQQNNYRVFVKQS